MKTFELLKLGVEIDEEDLHLLEERHWHINNKGYVVTSGYSSESLGLHILSKYGGSVPEGFVIEHHNGKPKDNSKLNLYLRTRKYNTLNTDKTTGVRVTTSGRFQARINQQNLGSFDSYDEAVNARAFAVLKELENEPYKSFDRIAYHYKQAETRARRH